MSHDIYDCMPHFDCCTLGPMSRPMYRISLHANVHVVLYSLSPLYKLGFVVYVYHHHYVYSSNMFVEHIIHGWYLITYPEPPPRPPSHPPPRPPPNTQECPQCNSTIEKDGGCNHMICKKCNHDFCWVCLGKWEPHGSSWYSCNRYDESEAKKARDSQEVR